MACFQGPRLQHCSPQLLDNRLIRQRLPQRVHRAAEGLVGKQALQATQQEERQLSCRAVVQGDVAGLGLLGLGHPLPSKAPHTCLPAARCSRSMCCPGSSVRQACCDPAAHEEAAADEWTGAWAPRQEGAAVAAQKGDMQAPRSACRSSFSRCSALAAVSGCECTHSPNLVMQQLRAHPSQAQRRHVHSTQHNATQPAPCAVHRRGQRPACPAHQPAGNGQKCMRWSHILV